jgi:hypothetical protein
MKFFSETSGFVQISGNSDVQKTFNAQILINWTLLLLE